MSTERFAAAMGYIDDDLISDAIGYTPTKRSYQYKKVLHYRRQSRTWKNFVTACVCISFLLGLSLSSEIRAITYSWMQKTIGNYTDFWFIGNNSEKLPNYRLTWLPDGYVLIHEEVSKHQVSAMYHNTAYSGSDSGFSFTYGIMQDESYTSIMKQHEEDELTHVEINGLDGELYLSSDPNLFNSLLWFDNEHGVYFILTSYLEKEDMLRIAKGVVLVSK